MIQDCLDRADLDNIAKIDDSNTLTEPTNDPKVMGYE